jgi:hypothetical protein
MWDADITTNDTSLAQQSIIPELTVEWYDENQIVVYRSSVISRAVLERWADLNSQHA